MKLATMKTVIFTLGLTCEIILCRLCLVALYCILGLVLYNVKNPGHKVQASTTYDDGLYQDGKPGDGIYRGDFLADRAGNYNGLVQV